MDIAGLGLQDQPQPRGTGSPLPVSLMRVFIRRYKLRKQFTVEETKSRRRET
jgi:hypothetical protein